jgi:type VI secretion system secreted protein VgrG
MDKQGNKLKPGTEYIIFDEHDKEIERGKLDRTGLVKLETEEPNKQYKIHVEI